MPTFFKSPRHDALLQKEAQTVIEQFPLQAQASAITDALCSLAVRPRAQLDEEARYSGVARGGGGGAGRSAGEDAARDAETFGSLGGAPAAPGGLGLRLQQGLQGLSLKARDGEVRRRDRAPPPLRHVRSWGRVALNWRSSAASLVLCSA